MSTEVGDSPSQKTAVDRAHIDGEFDGSLSDSRYPKLAVAVDGPEDGIVGTPLPRLVGPFLKPGTDTVTVSYSMNEPDLRKWQGWPGISSVSAVMSERLRRLPMRDLTDSFEVTVRP